MSVLFRILGGFAGAALLALFYNAIFVEGQIPIASGGYYGPVIFPLGMFFAIAFLLYAVGGDRLLRKFAPNLAAKERQGGNRKEPHLNGTEGK